MIELTGAEALWRSLAPEGIDTVYGLTGGKLGALMSAIARSPGTRFIGARHEGGASLMAAGAAATGGGLAVVIGECGSGAVNLASGIAVANANSLPLLAITSNNQRAFSYPNRGMFAEMDTESLFRPITKWNTAVHDGRRIPELAHAALREAHTGRRGAVHLDVPQDVLREKFAFDDRDFPPDPRSCRLTEGPAPTGTQIEAAAALLRGASRPLLIAGGGVVQAGASAEFRELVATVGAAATATQSALGVVSSADPHYVGCAAVTSGPAFERACREADVVLAVGCRLSPWLWDERGPMLHPDAELIHVSTDAATLGLQRALSVGILSDAKLALRALIEGVRGMTVRAATREWRGRLATLHAEHRRMLASLAQDAGEPMHPAVLAAEVAAALPADALVVYDGGHTTFWSNDFTPALAPRTRFNEVGMTQLGFGLPFALAAKLGRPEAPVFNITGDGAIGFTIQELDTARRYGVPVVNIVHNNASWGVIKMAHQRGFGCHGEVVAARAEVRGAIERALGSGLPAVLDCRVRFEAHPGLASFGRMGSGMSAAQKSA